MQNKIDPSLVEIIERCFTVARWTYGATHIETNELDPSPPMLMLIRKNSGRKEEAANFEMVQFDPSDIPHKRGEDRREEIAEGLAKIMLFGVADYVLAITEVGMHSGNEIEAKRLQRDIETKGINHPDVTKQVMGCAALTLYDLSGLSVRLFASRDHCIGTFLKYPNLFDLVEAHDNEEEDKQRSTDMADLINPKYWIYDEDIDDDEKDAGPLSTDWGLVLTKALKGYGDLSKSH